MYEGMNRKNPGTITRKWSFVKWKTKSLPGFLGNTRYDSGEHHQKHVAISVSHIIFKLCTHKVNERFARATRKVPAQMQTSNGWKTIIRTQHTGWKMHLSIISARRGNIRWRTQWQMRFLTDWQACQIKAFHGSAFEITESCRLNTRLRVGPLKLSMIRVTRAEKNLRKYFYDSRLKYRIASFTERSKWNLSK